MIAKKFACRTAITASLLFSVTACSLWNPHVGVSVKERDKIYYRMANGCANDLDQAKMDKRQSPYCDFHGTLPGAIEYANALREDYYDAVGDQSKLKNGLALALVPISAAALYFGISGGSSDVILGLATAGAAGLGLGYFFSSEPRQKVYLSGSLAVSCAVARTLPYLVPKTEWEGLQTIATKMPQLQATLQSKIVAANVFLGPEIAPELSQALLEQIKAAIDDGNEALADGQNNYGKLNLFLHKVDDAGPSLFLAVDEIRDKVSQEVLKTEPGLAQIQSLISGLPGQVQTALKSAALPKETPQGSTTSENNMAELALAAYNELVAATVAMRSATNQIEPFLAEVAQKEQKVAALPACAVAPAEVATFTIAPDTNSTEIKKDGSFSIRVTNAFGSVKGQIIGNGAQDGLQITTVPSGDAQTLTIVGKKVGEYSVLISDGSGKGARTLTVKVTS